MRLHILWYHVLCSFLQSLSFECTNLAGLEQVNALAQLSSPLHSLTVSPCGNPITDHTLFFPYTIFRLRHLGLTQLNTTTISQDDVATAEGLFGHLGEMTTSCLPRTRLLALVRKHRSLIRLFPHANILLNKDVCWLLTQAKKYRCQENRHTRLQSC